MLRRLIFVPFATLAAAAPASHPQPERPLPFGAGERLAYAVSFGKLHIGSGHMTVLGMDTVQDHAVWHAELAVSGGPVFFHVRDTTSSWFDVGDFDSRRFIQHLNEGPYHVRRDFRIEPESGRYTKNHEPTTAASPNPLDDVSLIYFVRTLPLATGDQYVLNRYFQPENNPVIIAVVRRERITVPAGTFNSIVVVPTIKSTGIFSQNGHAELWFSDDSSRVLLQMKASLPFGSINLYLKQVERADTAGRQGEVRSDSVRAKPPVRVE